MSIPNFAHRRSLPACTKKPGRPEEARCALGADAEKESRSAENGKAAVLLFPAPWRSQTGEEFNQENCVCRASFHCTANDL